MLLWKPFTADARPPRWFQRSRRLPETTPGKVTVTTFVHGHCMARNLVTERAKRAAEDLGDRVLFREIDASERSTVAEWGLTDALFVDQKELTFGPPPSNAKIREQIERHVRRL